MSGNVVIGAAMNATLLTLNRTRNIVESIHEKLATGKNVNSAIDDPQNFFLAQALGYRASDYSRLLDGIYKSIRTLEETGIGLEALEDLAYQAEAIALESLAAYQAGELDSKIVEEIVDVSPVILSKQITDSNPVGYWRLNEISGGTATNLGSGAGLDSGYAGGVSQGAAALYDNGGAVSSDFDGVNDRVNVPDSNLINLGSYAERTVELVFNADSVAGRQVLFEEGATVNGFAIYIDNGLLRVTGEDDQGADRWVDADISTPIVAGETYHVAFVFDQPNNSFTGYVNGVDIGSVSVNNAIFPSHGGNITIGAAGDGVQFHDGDVGGNGYYFDGRISDVAIYNTALNSQVLRSHADSFNTSQVVRLVNSDFNKVLEQINRITIDAQYQGINLLAGETLRTDFNEDRTSYLLTEGDDFSYQALGIIRYEFDSAESVEIILESVRSAIEKIKSFGRTIANDLSIIKTRSDFSKNLINNHLSGADDLVNADINVEGANQLAAQTRVNLATTALSLAANSQASILQLFERR